MTASHRRLVTALAAATTVLAVMIAPAGPAFAGVHPRRHHLATPTLSVPPAPPAGQPERKAPPSTGPGRARQASRHGRRNCAVPSAPGNVTASGSANAATVTWTAPSGNGTALDAYVLRAVSGPDLGQSVSVDPSATSATMTGLAAAQTSFSLAAHSPCGLGPAVTSNAVTVSGTASTYASGVLTGSPDVFYRMADSSLALMADSSGNAFDGGYEDNGDATLGTAGPLPGDPSTALSGIGGYAPLATVGTVKLPERATARTVEVWVQDTYDESGRALVSWGTDSTDEQFSVAENANGITVDAGNDAHTLTSPYPLDDGVWHLLTVTVSGSKITMYVDGVSIGTATFTGTLDTTGASLAVGYELYQGSEADLAVYPTALSAATVAAHFTASGLARPAPVLNPSAADGANKATISWTDAPAGTSPVTGYLVTSLAAGSTPGDAVTVAPGDTSATLTGLAAGSYTFQVQAVDSYGLSPAVTTSAVSLTGTASTYASQVLAVKPDAFYRLADSSLALAADSSGHAAEGVYETNGDATLGTPGPLAGDPSTGLSGEGGYAPMATVNIATLPQGATARTVEVWVQDTYDESGRALASWGNGNTDQGFNVYENANGITVDAGNDSHMLTSPFPLDDGVWHLITVTVAGSKITMYVDGVSIGTATFTGTLDTTGTSLAIGNQLYQGSEADLAIYPTALPAATIAAHFTASGLGRPGPAQVVHAAYGGPNAADISWGAAQAPGTAISGYLISALDGPTAGESVTASPQATGVRLWGLAPGSYAFQVQAVDSYGLGTTVVSNTMTVTGAAAPYAAQVLASSPDAFYRLADSSLALTADSSGHAAEGVYQNNGVTTLGTPGPLAGDPFTGLSGEGGYAPMATVNIATLPQGATARTVEVWAQDTYDESGRALASWGNGNTDQGFNVYENANGITVDANGDSHSLTSPFPLDDGAWHLLTVTVTGSKITMYVDGVSIGTATFTGTLDTTGTSLAIGDELYQGSEADLAIYPTALPAAAIAAHFTASGLGPAAPVLNASATGGANQATISWTDAPRGTSPVEGYLVTALAGGTVAGDAVTVAASDTSATLSGLASGSYSFQVQAEDSYGLGAAVTTSAVSVTGTASTYASQVLASNPDAFYRLADSSLALMADSSGHAAQGVYEDNGVATLGTAGPLVGDPSTALSGSGGETPLATVNIAALPSGKTARTVEVWVQDTYDESGRALASWGNGNTDQGFTVYENANGVTVDAGNDSHMLTSPYPLDDGAWHLITVTVSGSKITMYVDGASIGTATFTGTLDTTGTSLAIGDELYQGSEADLAIYPTALPAATVAAHFTASGVTTSHRTSPGTRTHRPPSGNQGAGQP
jgi:hypothetical protein